VVSGAISLAAGDGPETLLEVTAANLVVSATLDRGDGPTITIHNGTVAPLQGAQDLDGTTTSVSLAAGAQATIELPDARTHRLHVQLFPNAPEFPDVVTLLVSVEHGLIAGQAFVSAIE
jgi:hypothetical protein